MSTASMGEAHAFLGKIIVVDCMQQRGTPERVGKVSELPRSHSRFVAEHVEG
jgi:hypothetical protein